VTRVGGYLVREPRIRRGTTGGPSSTRTGLTDGIDDCSNRAGLRGRPAAGLWALLCLPERWILRASLLWWPDKWILFHPSGARSGEVAFERIPVALGRVLMTCWKNST
jgi:hypothetical protein